jgi:deoxyadenosine kinase
MAVTPEESFERIKLRSRNCECGIPMEYLQRLHGAYEDFLEVSRLHFLCSFLSFLFFLFYFLPQDISRIIPTIRVNYSRFHSVDEMADMIVKLGVGVRARQEN